MTTDLPAGAELDKRIAELKGWTCLSVQGDLVRGKMPGEEVEFWEDEWFVPRYSTSDSAAVELENEMIEAGCRLCFSYSEGLWLCTDLVKLTIRGRAETRALAVARAYVAWKEQAK